MRWCLYKTGCRVYKTNTKYIYTVNRKKYSFWNTFKKINPNPNRHCKFRSYFSICGDLIRIWLSCQSFEHTKVSNSAKNLRNAKLSWSNLPYIANHWQIDKWRMLECHFRLILVTMHKMKHDSLADLAITIFTVQYWFLPSQCQRRFSSEQALDTRGEDFTRCPKEIYGKRHCFTKLAQNLRILGGLTTSLHDWMRVSMQSEMLC